MWTTVFILLWWRRWRGTNQPPSSRWLCSQDWQRRSLKSAASDLIIFSVKFKAWGLAVDPPHPLTHTQHKVTSTLLSLARVVSVWPDFVPNCRLDIRQVEAPIIIITGVIVSRGGSKHCRPVCGSQLLNQTILNRVSTYPLEWVRNLVIIGGHRVGATLIHGRLYF